MLDERDLEAIAALISASADDTKNVLLDEMGRVQNYLGKQLEQLQKNLEELQQYYRITKLENDNTALLLKMIDELSKRVEELEKKTA